MKRTKPDGVILTLAELKRRAIFDAMDKCGGDVRLAADALGVGKTTIYKFLEDNPYTPPGERVEDED